MPQFFRTAIQSDVSLAASTTTDLIDLPVNPISHVLLTIKANNNTPTLANYRFLSSMVAFLTRVAILYKGQAIIEGRLDDLMILNAMLTGYIPAQNSVLNTDNNRRAATFMFSFSRVPYWQEEAFPATSRGEFQIRLTSGAAPTGMDTMFYDLETVELLNASPNRFLKYTSYTGTASSTGRDERDLPRGNPILGVLLFGTTTQTTTSGVNTIEDVQVRVDNVEQYFGIANWEALHNEVVRRIPGATLGLQGHFHHALTTASSDIDTDDPELRAELLESYAWMDFDPLKDSQYALLTEGRGRVSIRANFNDTAVMRFMPVELVGVAGATQR